MPVVMATTLCLTLATMAASEERSSTWVAPRGCGGGAVAAVVVGGVHDQPADHASATGQQQGQQAGGDARPAPPRRGCAGCAP